MDLKDTNLKELLQNVASDADYRIITQDIETVYRTNKFDLNWEAVSSLQKVQPLEIQYFSKFNKHGAAFRILERLFLHHESSRKWNALAIEMLGLIRYWLDAVRDHMIHQGSQWWLFLKPLLKFIEELLLKDPGMGNLQIHMLADSLLYLATSDKTGVEQVNEILAVFNASCTSASRDFRAAFKKELDGYLVKLSHLLPTWGDYPTQYAALQTLMRFLVDRKSVSTRVVASKVWFTSLRQEAMQLFLQRRWIDFCKDGRDFLNALNAGGDHVLSVLCNRFQVGGIALCTGSEKAEFWVDFNVGTATITVLRPMKGDSAISWIKIEARHVDTVTLNRSSPVTISMSTLNTASIYPPMGEKLGAFGDKVNVLIKVNLCDLDRVDRALSLLFGDKYQSIPEAPRPSTKLTLQSPASGIAEPPRTCGISNSISSASTSSLAQLADKLKAHKPYDFNLRSVKKPVVAPPDLSCVTEVSENDDILVSSHHSIESCSTLVINPYRVGHNTFKYNEDDRQSKSDDNRTRPNIERHDAIKAHSDSDAKKKSNKTNNPAMNMLLSMTMRAADPNLLIRSLECMPQDMEDDFISTDDLLNRLREESLLGSNNYDPNDSGVITAEKESQGPLECSVVENTPSQGFEKIIGSKCIPPVQPADSAPEKITRKNSVKVSTSDESNTSAINDTSMTYVNVRRGNLMRQQSTRRPSTPVREILPDNDDEQWEAIDKLFSQHKQNTGYTVSPTRARQINASSDSSAGEDVCLISSEQFNVISEKVNFHVEEPVDIDIDPEKNIDSSAKAHQESEATKALILDDVQPPDNVANAEKPKTKPTKAQKKPVKKPPPNLKIKGSKGNRAKAAIHNKLQIKPAQSSLSVNTCNKPLDDSVNNKKSSIDSKESDSPRLIRKKRKLYSPKDDNTVRDTHAEDDLDDDVPLKVIQKRKSNLEDVSASEDDRASIQIKQKQVATSISSRSRASCYIDIEKDRKKFRSKRRMSQCTTCISPKSKQRNDLFDRLKDNIEGTEKVILVDKKADKDFAVYNFTSDSGSEDGHLKTTNIKNQSRPDVTPVGSKTSLASTRQRKATTKNKNNLASSSGSSIPVTRKPPPRRGRKPKIEKQLEDEKMRVGATEELNTSIVPEKLDNDTINQLEPEIVAPQIIDDDQMPIKSVVNTEGKNPSKKKEIIKSDVVKHAKMLKKDSTPPKQQKKFSEDRTSSPLPALEVETVNVENQEADDSVISTNLVQKITKMYHNQDFTDETNTTQNLLLDAEGAEVTVKDISYKNDAYMCADLGTENRSKLKRCSDVSVAEKENNNSKFVRTDNNVACDTGSALKKKNLTLKKKTTVELCKDALTRVAVVKLKNEDIIAIAAKRSSDNSDSRAKSDSIKVKNVNYDTNDSSKSLNSHGHVTDRKALPKTKHITDIFMTADDESASDMSISSAGITAHGVWNESPPGSQEFKETFVPRNLENFSPHVREMIESPEKKQLKVVVELLSLEDVSTYLSDSSNAHDKTFDTDFTKARFLSTERKSECPRRFNLLSNNTKKTSETYVESVQKEPIPNIMLADCFETPKTVNDRKLAKENIMRKSLISPLTSLSQNSTVDSNKVRHEKSNDEMRISTSQSNTSSVSHHTRQVAKSMKMKPLKISKEITVKDIPRLRSPSRKDDIHDLTTPVSEQKKFGEGDISMKIDRKSVKEKANFGFPEKSEKQTTKSGNTKIPRKIDSKLVKVPSKDNIKRYLSKKVIVESVPGQISASKTHDMYVPTSTDTDAFEKTAKKSTEKEITKKIDTKPFQEPSKKVIPITKFASKKNDSHVSTAPKAGSEKPTKKTVEREVKTKIDKKTAQEPSKEEFQQYFKEITVKHVSTPKSVSETDDKSSIDLTASDAEESEKASKKCDNGEVSSKSDGVSVKKLSKLFVDKTLRTPVRQQISKIGKTKVINPKDCAPKSKKQERKTPESKIPSANVTRAVYLISSSSEECDGKDKQKAKNKPIIMYSPPLVIKDLNQNTLVETSTRAKIQRLSPSSEQIINMLKAQSPAASQRSHSECSTSTPIIVGERSGNTITRKRTSRLNDEIEPKRLKLGTQLSGASKASILSWLNSTQERGQVNPEIEDIMNDLEEQLNLALMGHQENFRRNVVRLMAEAQDHDTQHVRTLDELQKQHSDISRLLDNSSRLLDKAREQRQELRTWLYKGLAQLIKQDRKQKDDIIRMLKEDIEFRIGRK